MECSEVKVKVTQNKTTPVKYRYLKNVLKYSNEVVLLCYWPPLTKCKIYSLKTGLVWCLMQFYFLSKSCFKNFFWHFCFVFCFDELKCTVKSIACKSANVIFRFHYTHTVKCPHAFITDYTHTHAHSKWIVTVISEAWWWGRKKILPHIAGSCQNISIYISFLFDPHYNCSVYVIICQFDGNRHPWLLTLGTSLCACVHLCILALEGSLQMCSSKHCLFCILRFE